MGDLSPREIIQCAVWYYANEPMLRQFEAASGRDWDDLHRSYQEEKIADYRRGMSHWFSRFDLGRQTLWVAAAVERYADDARKQTRANQEWAQR